MNKEKYERRKRREEAHKAEKEYSKKEKPKRREKYGDMSAFRRAINQYTGFIIIGSVLLSIVFIWFLYDSTIEDFEKFTCSEVSRYPAPEGLTPDQLVKWNNIVAECQGKFTPP